MIVFIFVLFFVLLNASRFKPIDNNAPISPQLHSISALLEQLKPSDELVSSLLRASNSTGQRPLEESLGLYTLVI